MATKTQARFQGTTNADDGTVHEIGEATPAENWREESKGKFVRFNEEQVHVVTFQCETPEKQQVEFRGKEKTAYRWPVLENGVERILSVCSGRLLSKLGRIKPLKGKTLRLEYLPMVMDYAVEVQDG